MTNTPMSKQELGHTQTPEEAVAILLDKFARISGREWKVEARLKDDVLECGAYVYAPYLGAICSVPKKSPFYSAADFYLNFITDLRNLTPIILEERAFLLSQVRQKDEALRHAEAVMSIVEPRSDKKEYLECLTKVRAALSPTPQPDAIEHPRDILTRVLKNGHGGGNWRRLLIGELSKFDGEGPAQSSVAANFASSPSVSGRGQPSPAPQPDAAPADETDAQMLARLSDDASAWAAEFRKTALKLGYSDMDEGWLISWFANAIVTAQDKVRPASPLPAEDVVEAAAEAIYNITPELYDGQPVPFSELTGYARDLKFEQAAASLAAANLLRQSAPVEEDIRAHRVMTPEEYSRMKIIGWHSVCRDVDGFGAVGFRYGSTPASPPGDVAGMREEIIESVIKRFPMSMHPSQAASVVDFILSILPIPEPKTDAAVKALVERLKATTTLMERSFRETVDSDEVFREIKRNRATLAANGVKP